MLFEWDERKNRQNKKKHGVSFELAASVFNDPHALSIPDDSCETEERWLTTGAVEGVLIILIVHIWQEGREGEGYEEVVRIISARKATPAERQAHENQFKRT
jgi:uncharacterized protein